MSKTYRVNPRTHEEVVEKQSRGQGRLYSQLNAKRRRRERSNQKREGWDG